MNPNKQTLKFTYDKLQSLNTSYELEGFDIVDIVDDYRNYWKPKKVETILLAESHVYTSYKDSLITHNIRLENYPKRFVRFVYNLSYGQSDRLNNQIKNNRGTPQFWKLFNQLGSRDFRIVNNQDKLDKLNEKNRLLNNLKDNGIWLMDCSIVGIYNKGLKPNKYEYELILKTSYHYYINNLLEELNPDKIIVIGKSIYEILNAELGQLNAKVDWIHQPNARIKKADRKDFDSIKP